MRQIQTYFKPDGLGRLARSTQEYYESHGDYLPNVAALAHAALLALEAAEAREKQLVGLLSQWNELGYVAGGGYDGTLKGQTLIALGLAAGGENPADSKERA